MTRFSAPLLSLMSLGSLILAIPFTFAQRSPVEIPMMSIDAILLDEQSPPDLLFRTTEGEYQPFVITQNARGDWNTMPLSRELVLYREGVNEEGNPTIVPAFTIPLPASERMILFFYRDANKRLGHLILDDSEGTHPAGTGRLVNLTSSRIASQVNGQLYQLEPMGQQVTGPLLANRDRFTFGFAVQGQQGYVVESPVRSFRLPSSEMRFMAALTYNNTEVQVDDDTTEEVRAPTAIRLYDRVQAPVPLGPQ